MIEQLYWTLIGTLTPGQSGPGSNTNEEVLHIDHTPSLFQDTCWEGGLNPYKKVQLAYSTAPADRAGKCHMYWISG